MRLTSLSIENFGIFRGCHEFKFAHASIAEQRNVTLFCGTNGAGKTTLFSALKIALFGQSVLGERVTQQEYNHYLLHKLHRLTSDGAPTASKNGRVRVLFDYVQSGRTTSILVDRSWIRSGSIVSEQLDIHQDGIPVPVPATALQHWLSDLVPQNQTLVMFFDAERLDEMASPEQSNRALGEAARRLFGIDLVDRLEADLEQYTLKHGGGKTSRLSRTVPQLQTEVDQLDEQITNCRSAIEGSVEIENQTRDLLAVAERRLATEGGHYASERPNLQLRQSAIQQEIAVIETKLRDDCAHLLPFALCPELCDSLAASLSHEAEVQRRNSARDLWNERLGNVRSALNSKELWHGLDVQKGNKTVLIGRLLDILALDIEEPTDRASQMVHMLSDIERESLQQSIRIVERTVPREVIEAGNALKELSAENKAIAEDLARVPDDAVLAPIHNEITRLTALIQGYQKDQSTLREKLGALQFQREERDREKNRAAEELHAAQAASDRLRLAEGSKLVLKAYKDALARHKLKQLEDRIVTCFNELCQKDALLGSVTIDPDDFNVELRSGAGHIVRLDNFSAGERQLYVFATLWALRETCNQSLPLIIDTPVARLDEEHRSRVLHMFLPKVSPQVLLFATNVELDSVIVEEAASSIAQIYELQFNSDEGATEAIRRSVPATSRELVTA